MITKSLSNSSLIRLLIVTAAIGAAIAGTITTGTLASAQDQDEQPIVGYRILDESEAGPFTVQLQISPVAPIVGISRFAVRVRDTATGEDVPDAKVTILGSPAEHGEAQYTLVLNSPVDPTFYLSQLKMETAGVWAIDVRVESDLGDGTTIMSALVSERGRSGSSNLWGQALFGLVALSFVVGITWVWYSSKKALKRRDQQS
ncbi:MAG: hypothetical protein HOE43_07975 [Chloroflexi bacterium]|nr:hypothetical protein [Chloroflexota bacterium]